ncbi:MAG: nucleotide exchange factor GrpE [Thermovirga sp.]
MKRGSDKESLKDIGEDGRDFCAGKETGKEISGTQACGDEDSGPGETFEADMEALMKELVSARDLAEKLSGENKALNEATARARADFFNFRQRVEREQERSRQLAYEGAAAAFIPVLDNLDRALSSPQGDFDSLLKGVEMVRDQFFSVLENMGVALIETTGKPFDPAFHDAVAVEEPKRGAEDGIVTEEIQPGYMIAGKVLRAARVKVARGSS